MNRIMLGLMLTTQTLLHAGCFPEGVPIWTVASSVCSNIEAVGSQLDALISCGSQAIGQTEMLISTSGNYCLMQDVVGTITIASSYVHLDLNGHVIDAGVNGVFIGAALHDISIANGVIRNATQEGVLVQEGCARITLNDISVIGCAQDTDRYSIDFAGTVATRITDCSLSRIRVADASNGIRIQNGDYNKINQVNISNLLNTGNAVGIAVLGDSSQNAVGYEIAECFVSTVSSTTGNAQGITFLNVSDARVTNSRISGITASGSAFGFASTSGINNQCIDSCATDLQTFGGGFLGAFGFLMMNEQLGTLLGCSAEQCASVSNSAGFGLLGSQHMRIEQCSSTDMLSTDGNVSIFGIVVSSLGITSIDTVIDKMHICNIRNDASGQAVGMGFFQGVENLTLSNSVVQNIFANGQASGYTLNSVEGGIISDCTCIGVYSGGSTSGIALSVSNSVEVVGCSVNSVSSSNGPAVGFEISNTDRSACVDCSSMCVSSVNNWANGFLIQNSSAVSLARCESLDNDMQNSFNHAAGFYGLFNNNLIFDYCLTQSNSHDSVSAGVSNGFRLESTTNTQILNCTSLMNDDSAFYIDVFSNNGLVRNCLAAQSGQGFTDLSTTSTFAQNLAAFNGFPFDVTNNYSGIDPSVISFLADPVQLGTNISA